MAMDVDVDVNVDAPGRREKLLSWHLNKHIRGWDAVAGSVLRGVGLQNIFDS